MSEDTQINISTTTEIVNVDVTETLQPVSLECFFAQGSSSDTNIDVTETVQNIELNVTEVEAQNVEIDYFYPAGPPGQPGQSVWGTISGTLSTQTDLWKYLSAVGTSTFDIATFNSYISTNSILLCSLNVNGLMLSAGINLFDIFLTKGEESQTLSYNPQTYNLSISLGNTVSLSSLAASQNANAVFQTLSTQSITTGTLSSLGNVEVQGSLNVHSEILSGNIPLQDIFLTAETDSQTLFYDVTGEELSISSGNSISLSALSYRNLNIPLSSVQTIQEFAENFTSDIHPGYTVKLYNGRVYAFAGTDKNNPNHYLEVNTNPYKPIYREISLSGTETVIDSFFLGDFKTAKYNLQVETNFNNEIYYSEINVVGSVGISPVGAASEYGQIFTSQLVLKYDASIDGGNNLYLILYHNSDLNPIHKYLVKGHRTNFYKI